MYPICEQDGLKAQERRYTAYGKEKHREQVRVKAGVGAVGGLGARLIQELLEEEVTEFLGRAKSARRSESDNETGYRNGYGRPRRLTAESGNDTAEEATSPQHRRGVREPAADAVRPQDQEGCWADPPVVPAWPFRR